MGRGDRHHWFQCYHLYHQCTLLSYMRIHSTQLLFSLSTFVSLSPQLSPSTLPFTFTLTLWLTLPDTLSHSISSSHTHTLTLTIISRSYTSLFLLRRLTRAAHWGDRPTPRQCSDFSIFSEDMNCTEYLWGRCKTKLGIRRKSVGVEWV